MPPALRFSRVFNAMQGALLVYHIAYVPAAPAANAAGVAFQAYEV